MSGRTERDYRKVFEKMCDLVGPCDVKEFFSDFGKTIWRGAINALHDDVKMFSCALHWCQVYQNLKKIGLV